MKQRLINITLITIIFLGGLLTSCSNDIILDTSEIPTSAIPPKNTPVDPTSLPSNQVPNNTGTGNEGRPPLFVSQAVTRVIENKDYSYTIKVDDPDFGDSLTVSALKLPSWLELKNEQNDSVLQGKPSTSHIGGHLVELAVTDSKGLQSKQIFYVYVLDASSNNSAPSISNQSISTREDELLNIELQAQDIDGDTLSYTITNPPQNGQLIGNAPKLSYKPNLNSNGQDSFSFTASDGNTVSKEATISIRIIPINDAPSAQNKEITIDKNSATEVILLAEDVETASLSYSITAEPKFGSLSTLYGNKVSYTPRTNHIGEDTFSFKASDGQFSSNTATITVKIIDPVIQPEPEPEPEPEPPTPTPPTPAPPASSKYRVLISTDVGLDPDDIQSLYRLVHYSDIFDIEGIIASIGLRGYEPSPTLLRQSLRNIEVDTLRAKGYTDLIDQATLLAQVKVGKRTKGTPKAGQSSEGSNHIIQQVKAARQRGDTRPLWILVWGPVTDVAQALRDDPSIASSIRIFSIGSVNSFVYIGSREYIFNFVKNTNKNLFWIDNSSVGERGFKATYSGTYTGGNQTGEWAAKNFVSANIRGHGKAGDSFPLASPALKEGDSPTLLYFIGNEFGNVGDVNNPTSESWGGTYKRFAAAYPNYYVDCCNSQEAAKVSISKWRLQYLRHWKARWDRYLE